MLKPYLRWSLRIFLGLIAVLALLILLVTLFVDPNDYKADIENYVKEKTGRKLQIRGKLSVSVFPWVGISAHQIELDNPANFTKGRFAAIGRLDVKAQLWSLLFGKLVTDRLVIHDLDLNWESDLQGKSNMDDLLDPKSTAPTPPPSTNKKRVHLDIRGIEVVNAKISYHDRKTGDKQVLDKITVHVGSLGGAGANDVDFTMRWHKSSLAAPLNINFKGRLELDTQKQTLRFSTKNLQLDEMRLSLQLSGDKLFTTPEFHGDFSSNSFTPRRLVQALGIADLEFNDKRALKNAQISAAFAHTGQKFSLKKLKLKLDDTTALGNLSINTSKSVSEFDADLVLDQLNIDLYETHAASVQKPDVHSSKTVKGKAAPFALLPDWRGNGKVTIKKLLFSNAELTDIQLNLRAQPGRWNLQPIQANFYQGRYQGGIELARGTGKQMRLKVNERVQNINLALLTERYMPDLLKKNLGIKHLSGTAHLNAQLDTEGLSATQWQHNANGNLGFTVKNGHLRGLSIIYRACELYLTSRGRPTPPHSEAYERFVDLTGTVILKDGVGRTQDFAMNGQMYSAKANGYFDLRQNLVDFHFQVTVIENCTPDGAKDPDQKKIEIPLRCKGAMQSIKCGLDAKIIQKEVGQKVLDKLLKGKDGDNDSSDKDSRKDLLRKLLR